LTSQPLPIRAFAHAPEFRDPTDRLCRQRQLYGNFGGFGTARLPHSNLPFKLFLAPHIFLSAQIAIAIEIPRRINFTP
jgi:hypothetical protein